MLGEVSSWKTLNESAKMFSEELAQVAGAPSIYFAPEEETIGVEHLLAEPEHDDMVDILLNLNECTFDVPKSYYFKEFSAVESVLRKSDDDARQRPLTEDDKTKEKFVEGLSKGNDDNYYSISCEDFLLDVELGEETPTLHDVTTGVSSIGDVNWKKNLLADSDGKNCGPGVFKLSNASTSSDHDALRIDEMSTDRLLKVFQKMFGRQPSITDEQGLKCHITFGLQNQEIGNKNLIFPECCLDSGEDERTKVPPARGEKLLAASTAFASVFNFRTKPRVQNVKRRQHIYWNSFKCLSSGVGEIKFDSPVKWSNKIKPLIQKRSHQSAKRHIKKSREGNVKCDRRKSGISEQFLKCKPPKGGFGRRYYHKGTKVPLRGFGKRNSLVGCVQVTSEGHFSKSCRTNRAENNIHATEAQGSPSGTLSAEFDDDSSEDEWSPGTEAQCHKQQRKHKYWSTPEVIKLVEGVSKYGVGRWTDIKRDIFPSSEHRSPVDLKDKWRNLLRTSCQRSKSRRGVEAKQKRGLPSIPHHVLNRIRELSVIHTYPRESRARVLPAAFVASSSKTESDNRCSSTGL